jgi:hypothetical protein
LLISNSALFRRPDDFVLLDLKAHGQRIGDDFFRQFFSRNRRQIWRELFSGRCFVRGRERMHPRKQQRTN